MRASWARALVVYFVLAPIIAFAPLVLLLVHRASGERAALVDRARSHARLVSSVFERETVAAANFLKGLVGSPARLNGDLAAFYDQLKRTERPPGSWIVLWDLERQLLNTLQPLGARLPAIADFPSASATLERIRGGDLAVSDRVVSRVNGASLVAVHLRTTDGEGRMNGVLTASLPAATLRALVNEQPLQPGWVVSLFDRNIAHVASSGSALPFGEGPWPRLPDLTGAQGDFGSRDPQAPARIFFDRSGPSGYTAMVRVPQSSLDEPFDRALRQIALSGIALALTSGLAASLFARRLSEPVQRLAEKATKVSDDLMFAQARHESFWTHTPESLFMVRVLRNGRLLMGGINPAHERMTGLRSDEIAGRAPHEFLPPDVAEAITARYRRCIERGEPIAYDEVLDLPAGRRSWRTSLTPVRDPASGRVVLLFGSARDVTAERQARDELARLNEQLRSILSSVSDCYCTLGRDYRLTAANAAALKWLGVDETAAIGMQVRHLFGPERPCGAAIVRAMEKREVVHEELPSGLHAGHWISYHIYPSAGGVSVFFRDVTEARKAREAIAEISRQLLVSQEEERKRIANELHDSTSQHLVAASLGLMRLPPASEAEERIRSEIDGSLAEALRELRIHTYLLHPPGLERDGLTATLRSFVDGFSRRSNLEIALVASPLLDSLPDDLQRAVFRVVQEALANSHRHAHATRIEIRTKLIRGALFVRIRDDGSGMAGARGGRVDMGEAPLGVGLPGMRERLRQFGGELVIRSGPAGTTLTAMVPLMRQTPSTRTL